MTSRITAVIGLLAALALGGCAGTGAVAGDDPSPSATATKTATESAHGGHGHDHGEHEDLVVEATLDPSCVEPGGSVTLTVDTAPRTGVLYLAKYSDGNSGADEPIGADYGGNGGGYADESGSFEESWTVSEDAPPGPGHIVLATVSGHQDESLEFAVADPLGECP